MSPSLSFSPIRLTIVDFLGVFLPGIVWTILLFTLWAMLDTSQGFPQNPNPLTIAYFLATGKDSFTSTDKAEEFSAAFYVGLTLLSVLLGYLNMALSTRLAEYTSRFLCRVGPFNRRIKGYLFPYNEYFQNQKYYPRLFDILKLELNLNSGGLPEHYFETSNHPFKACKCILKIHQSPLWEDVQYKEAQVRMLAALFMASLFNIVLALCDIINGQWWFIISLIIMFVLAHTFRYRRFREVEDVYLSTLLVASKERR